MKKPLRVMDTVVTAGDYNEATYKTIQVESSSTRRYHNTLRKLAKLSPCARLLLDYLAEQMNAENLVRNDKRQRIGFNNLIHEKKGSHYADSSIHKALSELLEQDLLLRVGKRGTLRVNPLYYFRGDERRRGKLIRQIFSIP